LDPRGVKPEEPVDKGLRVDGVVECSVDARDGVSAVAEAIVALALQGSEGEVSCGEALT
jgi:hypothetical protein